MREVVMDTNFLLLPFQFRIDVFTELDYVLDEPYLIVISEKVIAELKGLSKKIGKTGSAARFALKLVEAKKPYMKIIKTNTPVDDWLFEYAREHKAIACTNDAALKRKLRAEKLKIVGLRGRTKLGYV
jgi:rRNA-processing protein FCF1